MAKKIESNVKVHKIGTKNKPATSADIQKLTNKLNQRIELWVYDEYGTGAIVESGRDLAKLYARAEEYVTGINVENALTSGQQQNNWEAHFPVFVKKGKVDTSRVYAGNKRDGKHYVYTQVDGKWVQSELKPTEDVRFFLGNIQVQGVKSRWYLTDHKGNEIKSLNDQLLERKTVLFVKFV